MRPFPKTVLRVVGGILLGALVGSMMAVGIFVLCACVCTAARPAQGLDDLYPLIIGIYATFTIGPLVGEIAGGVRVIRSERKRNAIRPETTNSGPRLLSQRISRKVQN